MLETKIKELRLNNGLTRKEFAEKINVSPAHVTRCEQKEINVNVNIIRNICNSFNISADWLLGIIK